MPMFWLSPVVLLGAWCLPHVATAQAPAGELGPGSGSFPTRGGAPTPPGQPEPGAPGSRPDHSASVRPTRLAYARTVSAATTACGRRWPVPQSRRAACPTLSAGTQWPSGRPARRPPWPPTIRAALPAQPPAAAALGGSRRPLLWGWSRRPSRSPLRRRPTVRIAASSSWPSRSRPGCSPTQGAGGWGW